MDGPIPQLYGRELAKALDQYFNLENDSERSVALEAAFSITKTSKLNMRNLQILPMFYEWTVGLPVEKLLQKLLEEGEYDAVQANMIIELATIISKMVAGNMISVPQGEIINQFIRNYSQIYREWYMLRVKVRELG